VEVGAASRCGPGAVGTVAQPNLGELIFLEDLLAPVLIPFLTQGFFSAPVAFLQVAKNRDERGSPRLFLGESGKRLGLDLCFGIALILLFTEVADALFDIDLGQRWAWQVIQRYPEVSRSFSNRFAVWAPLGP
jgi:hypothetical protein